MHIFPDVDFFASGRHRDEAQLSKNPAPQVEVDPRNDEIAVGCDEPSQIPQARSCALGEHLMAVPAAWKLFCRTDQSPGQSFVLVRLMIWKEQLPDQQRSCAILLPLSRL
jgi:hypothetical protein